MACTTHKTLKFYIYRYETPIIYTMGVVTH